MHLSKDVLNSFAKLAADSYLTKKTPLNTTLTKIAKDESLEPHQVEYVAATANHAVWEKLHGMDKKASYDFPLADSETIIGKLQTKPKAVIKEASLDYLSSPKMQKVASVGSLNTPDATKTIQLDSLDKIAANKRALKKELQNRFEKCSMAKEEISRKMTVLHSTYELTERDFVKQARTMIMETPFTERGAAMVKVAEFVASACGQLNQPLSADEILLAQGLMKKLSTVVQKQGLVKTADLKAPEEYIDMKMPAKIINGRHALYITIQTIKNIRKEYEPLSRGYEIVDSSLPELKEKIRGL